MRDSEKSGPSSMGRPQIAAASTTSSTATTTASTFSAVGIPRRFAPPSAVVGRRAPERRADKPGGLADAIPMQRLADIARNHRTANAKQGGEDEAHRVTPRIEKAGDKANKETNNDGVDKT